MRASLAVCWLATCATVAPSVVDAATPRIVGVVTIAGDGETIDRANVEAALASAIAYVPSLALDLADASTRRRILGCGVDSACLGAAVGDLGASLGLWIAIYSTANRHLVTARLVDSTGGLKKPRVVDVTAAELAEKLRALVFDVLASERHPPMGRVRLEVRPEDASVMVDATPTDRRDLFLAPGTHVLSADRDGHVPRSTEVAVSRGEVIDAALHLDPTPPSWYERPWTWVVAGAVVLAAGTLATVAVLERGPAPLVICHGARDAGCP